MQYEKAQTGILGNDHEVKFHEIEIQLFHEIKLSIMRSNLSNNIDQEVDTSIMRSKFPNNAFFDAFQSFDLMIVLAANKSIMRSKFKIKHYYGISISLIKNCWNNNKT